MSVLVKVEVPEKDLTTLVRLVVLMVLEILQSVTLEMFEVRMCALEIFERILERLEALEMFLRVLEIRRCVLAMFEAREMFWSVSSSCRQIPTGGGNSRNTVTFS
jgi:hypothetical protein